MLNVPVLLVAALLALLVPVAYVVARSWSRGTSLERTTRTPTLV